MRQMHVQVRWSMRERVLALANEHRALSPAAARVHSPDGGEDRAMVLLNLPNERVGTFVQAVRSEMEEAEFVLFTSATIPVETPVSEVRKRVRDVSAVSALELVLTAVQSMGSWRGEIFFAVLAGVISTYGVLFGLTYLLVGAMLVAPLGAPALTSVVAVAVGDPRMLGRGALRFGVMLAVHTACAALIGYAYGLRSSTALMEQITSLSQWTLLLALAAGAAGALSQVLADRSSMASGSTSGFLVAAALAPPSAVMGLSIPLGRWDYVAVIGFLLVLQYLSIGLGGWVVLALYGITPHRETVGRGSRTVRHAAVGGLVLLVGGLFLWQMRQGPRFHKADLSRKASALAREAIQQVPGAGLVEVDARFTRPDLETRRGEVLLVSAWVERMGTAPDSVLKQAVSAAIRRRVEAELPGVVPFVDVSVLAGRSSP